MKIIYRRDLRIVRLPHWFLVKQPYRPKGRAQEILGSRASLGRVKAGQIPARLVPDARKPLRYLGLPSKRYLPHYTL